MRSELASRPPRFLGDYELLDEVARGGMGLVYRARQIHLGRIVALKLIRGPALATYSELRRFRAEPDAVAQLDHPNIIPIYEFSQVDDQPFFSMKLVEAGTLARHVDQFKSDPRRAARIMAKVARAVHHAHQRAILHRDLKPSNILLDEHDEPFVTDFGLAKRIESSGGDDSHTIPGTVMGTPAYMPPEQARGETHSLSTAADVYSLGATLYEMLTGRPPFAADSVLELLQRVVAQEATKPRALNAMLDADIETICMKCLEKEPNLRYGSAQALAEDLESWLAGRTISARASNWWERVIKWARRRPEIAALYATVLFVFLAGSVGVLWQWRKAELARAALERSLYVSDMKLGEQAFANSQFERVQAMVDSHAGQTDLHGFEWHYLRAVTDMEAMVLSARRSPYGDLKFSPDGKLLATTDLDRNIRLFDSATGAPAGSFSGHRDAIHGLDFHPDGTLLASASNDRTVRLWEISSKRTVGLIDVFTSPVTGVAFSRPDGRRLATVCFDATVAVFDTKTRAVLMRTTLPTSLVKGTEGFPRITFDHSGKRLFVMAALGPLVTYALDAADGRHLGAPFEGSVDNNRVLSPDDRYLFLGGRLGTRVFDTISGAPLHSFQSEAKRLENLVVDERGELLVASATYSEEISVRDLKTRRELRRLLIDGIHLDEGGIDLSRDGRMLALGGGRGKVYILYNLLGRKSSTTTLGRERLQGRAQRPHCLAVDSAGRLAAIATRDGNVTIWDAVANRPLRTLPRHPNSVYGVAFSPDATLLASACADGLIRLWNTDDGSLVRAPLNIGAGQVAAVAFEPKSRRLVAGGDGRQLVTWDTATWSVIGRIPEAHEGPIQGIAFSRESGLMATAGGDQTVKLWDAGSSRPRRTLTPRRDPNSGATGPFLNVAFSDDGNQIVAACGDGTATVWNVSSGAVVHTLSVGQQGAVYEATFTPDCRRVVTAGADQTVKFWDAVIGKETFELRHPAAVSAAAVTSDGFRLIAVACDGTVTLWDATPAVHEPDRGPARATP